MSKTAPACIRQRRQSHQSLAVLRKEARRGVGYKRIQYEFDQGDTMSMQTRIANTAGQLRQWLISGQTLKYLIYAILLWNFTQYFVEEAQKASLILTDQSPLLAWMTVFVTTIDELGWLGLLLAFELETYWLSYQALSVLWVRIGLQALRLVCYGLLAHTVLSNIVATQRYLEIDGERQFITPCELVGAEIFFSHNLSYEVIDADNCQNLTSDTALFYLDDNVVTDAAGYQLEGWHTWVNLQDALLWLLVVGAIELSVWLQNAAITVGRWTLLALVARIGYGVLILDGVFWFATGHYLYAFDQGLWIAGFWAIEWNLKEWRVAIESGTNHDGVVG